MKVKMEETYIEQEGGETTRNSVGRRNGMERKSNWKGWCHLYTKPKNKPNKTAEKPH